MKRYNVNKRGSARKFNYERKRTHPANLRGPGRGGIRF